MEHEHDTSWSTVAIERPRCPRCGSNETIIRIPGLMMEPPARDAPSWLRYVGCVIDSRSCCCEACGFDWDVDEAGSTVIDDEQRLFELTGATNDDELADWLNDVIDLECWIMRDDGFESGIVLRIANSGTSIDFPTTLAFLIETVRDLEAYVIEEQSSVDRN